MRPACTSLSCQALRESSTTAGTWPSSTLSSGSRDVGSGSDHDAPSLPVLRRADARKPLALHAPGGCLRRLHGVCACLSRPLLRDLPAGGSFALSGSDRSVEARLGTVAVARGTRGPQAFDDPLHLRSADRPELRGQLPHGCHRARRLHHLRLATDLDDRRDRHRHRLLPRSRSRSWPAP